MPSEKGQQRAGDAAQTPALGQKDPQCVARIKFEPKAVCMAFLQKNNQTFKKVLVLEGMENGSTS